MAANIRDPPLRLLGSCFGRTAAAKGRSSQGGASVRQCCRSSFAGGSYVSRKGEHGREKPPCHLRWLRPLGDALLELGSCTHVCREPRGDAWASPSYKDSLRVTSSRSGSGRRRSTRRGIPKDAGRQRGWAPRGRRKMMGIDGRCRLLKTSPTLVPPSWDWHEMALKFLQGFCRSVWVKPPE